MFMYYRGIASNPGFCKHGSLQSYLRERRNEEQILNPVDAQRNLLPLNGNEESKCGKIFVRKTILDPNDN